MVEKLESSPGSIALSENSHEVHNEIQVNSVSEIVGDFGRWQAVLFIFFFIGAAFSAYHSLGLTFYAPNIVYWCARPTNYQNTSTEEWAKLAKNNETLQCYEVNTPKVKCQKWEYDSSPFTSTIIDEFDLTCDRAWLASLTQSSYMAGSMLAVIGLGQASDRWGRLPIIWLGFLIEILAAASCTFSFNIYQYLISRFLLAFGASGRWASGFVLILETSGIQYRSFLGIGMQFGWAFGYITLPLIAFMFRDYRLIQFVCFAPEILLIFCWSCVPESPRWLLSNKKLKRANKTIRKAIAMNKRSESSIEQKIAALMSKCKSENEEKSKQRKANLIDLWINPNIRSKTLILYFTWFVNSFIYYGLSLNTKDLGGNPFITVAIAGAIEIPAYILTYLSFEKCGRKLPLAVSMFGAGLGCLATIPFNSDPKYESLSIAFAMIGKFFVTGSYAMIYVYSAELFPTVVRNVGVGSCSMVARIGSIIAPFVKELIYFTHVGFVLTIFGALSVIDGFIVLLLPETKDKEIPDSFDEAEKAPLKAKNDSPSKSN